MDSAVCFSVNTGYNGQFPRSPEAREDVLFARAKRFMCAVPAPVRERKPNSFFFLNSFGGIQVSMKSKHLKG